MPPKIPIPKAYNLYLLCLNLFIWSIPELLPVYVHCDQYAQIYEVILFVLWLVIWAIILLIVIGTRGTKKTKYLHNGLYVAVSILFIVILTITLIKWIMFIANENIRIVNSFYSLPLCK